MLWLWCAWPGRRLARRASPEEEGLSEQGCPQASGDGEVPREGEGEMNGKEGWKDVTLEEVLKALDARAPDWAVRLADQQDFKDALRLDAERGKALLRYRASEKVLMIANACVEAVLEKEGEG